MISSKLCIREPKGPDQSKHQIIQALIDAPGHLELDLKDGLANGRKHSALIGVAVALYNHALKTKKAGAVVPGGIHQPKKPADDRTRKKTYKAAVKSASKGLLHKLYEQPGHTFAGFQRNITHKPITYHYIRNIAKQITAFQDRKSVVYGKNGMTRVNRI